MSHDVRECSAVCKRSIPERIRAGRKMYSGSALHDLVVILLACVDSDHSAGARASTGKQAGSV